mmetsp:Transcript_43434/g.88860  ORF Transcript_43434/g.88860 Transcript_43434/m.88860 type:complete len:136 (+) Transcript_43434:2380-2787(+)
MTVYQSKLADTNAAERSFGGKDNRLRMAPTETELVTDGILCARTTSRGRWRRMPRRELSSLPNEGRFWKVTEKTLLLQDELMERVREKKESEDLARTEEPDGGELVLEDVLDKIAPCVDREVSLRRAHGRTAIHC